MAADAVELRDGLIGEISILGTFSPGLDGFPPGLGKSRLSGATGTFYHHQQRHSFGGFGTITSVVRLAAWGTVDFDMNVNAIAEAEGGRDMLLFGPVCKLGGISPFAKLRLNPSVTGTLANPKQVPEYMVTKMIDPFLHPFRTLKATSSQLGSGTGTNGASRMATGKVWAVAAGVLPAVEPVRPAEQSLVLPAR